MSSIKNSKRGVANRALIFMLIGLFLMFGPINLGWIDGMNGGFALSALGFLITLAFFITWIFYHKLARRQDAILSGKNLVVHWKYSKEEWLKYAEAEHETDSKGKRILFFIISGFAIFFGILFAIIDPENGIYVLFVMLGLILIIGITAFLSIRIAYKRNKKYIGEAIITKDGIYMNKQLHVWGILSSKLETVVLITEESPPVIAFSYSAKSTKGDNSYSVRVPVPEGQEPAALHIVEMFNNEVLKNKH